MKAALSATIVTLIASVPIRGQTSTASADQATCAGLLSNSGVEAIQPNDSSARRDTTSARTRADTAGFGVGGARSGQPDIILRVGVHIDELRFNKQPNVRVRLCWGGDTLRVVQRDNLPSPVVAGTTYRNVYVAVELLGRLNAQCLADVIGVGNNAPGQQSRTQPSAPGAGNCAFLGGTAQTGAQNPRQQSP